MKFLDNEAQSLAKTLQTKIKAFQTLKECDIKINSFTDNGYWKSQCVDVIEELEWLLSLVKDFSSDEYKPTKIIDDTSISKNPRLIRGLYDKNLCDREDLKKPLENYRELNSAILERMNWIINKAMSKKSVVEKVVEKKVSKSIDNNTIWMIRFGWIASITAFLTNLDFVNLFPNWKFNNWFHLGFNILFATTSGFFLLFFWKRFRPQNNNL